MTALTPKPKAKRKPKPLRWIAPCPGCGAPAVWQAVVRVIGTGTTTVAYRIRCRCDTPDVDVTADPLPALAPTMEAMMRAWGGRTARGHVA